MKETRRGILALSHVFNDNSDAVRAKVIGIFVILGALNLFVWIAAFIGFAPYPALIGTAVLAYSFGLRHAVDADHISAIDNVTRKLMSENKRPVAVGFFFSLGHSTVVLVMSIVVALAALLFKTKVSLDSVGGMIGTSASALFLYLIAIINLIVLWDIFQTFQKIRRGEGYSEETLDEFLNKRGLMARFFRPLLRMTTKSWQMYPIGFLFGLGFETATEIAILTISASQVSKGLPIILSLLFPLLFLAGMALVDTADGVLMLGAYGWAFVKPVRKLYYNMNITLISILVALVIGTIEVFSVIANQFHLAGPFWDYVSNLDFGTMGFLIIGLFIVSWLLSTIIYKIKKFDSLEVKAAVKVNALEPAADQASSVERNEFAPSAD